MKERVIEAATAAAQEAAQSYAGSDGDAFFDGIVHAAVCAADKARAEDVKKALARLEYRVHMRSQNLERCRWTGKPTFPGYHDMEAAARREFLAIFGIAEDV